MAMTIIRNAGKGKEFVLTSGGIDAIAKENNITLIPP
jgi:hypothetical protein